MVEKIWYYTERCNYYNDKNYKMDENHGMKMNNKKALVIRPGLFSLNIGILFKMVIPTGLEPATSTV